MKVCVIVVGTFAGKFLAQAAATSEPIMKLAREARESGKFAGEEIAGGYVFHSERMGHVFKFRCDSPAKKAAQEKAAKDKAAAEKQAAKDKAAAEKQAAKEKAAAEAGK